MVRHHLVDDSNLRLDCSYSDPEFDPFLLEECGKFKEVSDEAIWTVSSAKASERQLSCVFSEDQSSFWQSEGPLPHSIRCRFSRLIKLSVIAIKVNFEIDESYTPKVITINYGYSEAELKNFMRFEIKEPKGWIIIPIYNKDIYDKSSSKPNDLFLKCPLCLFCFEIIIKSNHHDGKDSRIRQIKVFEAVSDQQDSIEKLNNKQLNIDSLFETKFEPLK